MTDQAQTIEIASGGLVLSGEVLRAEHWNPALAEISADNEAFFRIVVLQEPLEARPSIHDPLVAVVTRPSRTDARTLRERSASYQWRPGDPEAPMVFSRHQLPLQPQDLPDLSPEGGLARLAQALVDSAPLRPVFQGMTFPRPLRPRDVPLVFDGLFSPHPSLRAQHTLATFGQGLGLTGVAQPLTRTSGRSTGTRHIRRLLEEEQGYLEFDKLCREMRVQHGLPQWLALLYTLVFLATGRPESELRLRQAHGLQRRGGGVWRQDRLHGRYLRDIRWPANPGQAILALAFGDHRLWHMGLDWSRRILPLLKPKAGLEELPREQEALEERLTELGRSLGHARRSLERVLGGSLEEAPREEVSTLNRLEAVCRPGMLADFYNAARHTYPQPAALDQDLAVLARLRDFVEWIPEALALRSYLNAAQLRSTDLELMVDRVSILEQLQGDHLLRNPQLWPSVRSLFDWFKGRYQSAYRQHHQLYWQEAAELRRRLAGREAEAQGLARLNSIVELGPPLGGHLEQEYRDLMARLGPCPLPEGEAPELETEPVCSHCRLRLTEEVPRGAAARWEEALEVALLQQHRRLSNEAIRRVLARSQQPAIDRLLQVLRASDARPLVAVIDDRVVAFLRDLLAEAQRESVARPVLARLAAEFPTLSEAEVDQAVAAFRRLVEDALAELRVQHPGRRLRLDLEGGTTVA